MGELNGEALHEDRRQRADRPPRFRSASRRTIRGRSDGAVDELNAVIGLPSLHRRKSESAISS